MDTSWTAHAGDAVEASVVDDRLAGAGAFIYLRVGAKASLIAIALTQPDLLFALLIFGPGMLLWTFTGTALSSQVYYASDGDE